MMRCELSVWNGFGNRIKHIEDISLCEAFV